MEHRWGERRRLHLPVHLVCHAHAIGIGQLADVSTSGAWIRTALRPPLEAQVEVSIAISRAARELGWVNCGRLIGCVVRHGPHGIGIEWDEAACELLGELLQASLEQPPLPQQVGA